METTCARSVIKFRWQIRLFHALAIKFEATPLIYSEEMRNQTDYTVRPIESGPDHISWLMQDSLIVDLIGRLRIPLSLCESFTANSRMVDIMIFLFSKTITRHCETMKAPTPTLPSLHSEYIFHEHRLNRHPKPGRPNHKINSALARAQMHNRHR